MNRFLTLLLCLSFMLPGTAFASIPATGDPACPMLFRTEIELDNAIAGVLTDLKSSRSATESALIQKYGVRIGERIAKVCADPKGCTRIDMMKAAIEEADRIIGRAKTQKKVFGYAKLTSAMVSLIVISGVSTKFIDSDVIKILIGAQIGILINHLRAPLDALYETALRKKAFQQVSDAVDASRPENAGFKNSFQTMQATFTGLERDGRGVILGAQHDLTNHVMKLQGYLAMKAAGSEVQITDDQLARGLASLLYQARIFHADIPPSNPQLQSILSPTMAPLGPLYTRLEKKVRTAVHILEAKEAKTAGKKDYDKATADKFYDELVYEWFKREQPPLDAE
jgi:hypothetical protein